MSSNRPGRIRLSVDLPKEIHKAIKASADERGITITKWIIRACYRRLKLEYSEDFK